ncbi:MAG: hypothetical protein K8S16_04870 [Bacteroidales bacterium]|nr:hypothetical protein [Bacteroidales bacterium]
MRNAEAVYKRLIFSDRIIMKAIILYKNVAVYKRLNTAIKQYNKNLNFKSTCGYNGNKRQWVVVSCKLVARLKKETFGY